MPIDPHRLAICRQHSRSSVVAMPLGNRQAINGAANTESSENKTTTLPICFTLYSVFDLRFCASDTDHSSADSQVNPKSSLRDIFLYKGHSSAENFFLTSCQYPYSVLILRSQYFSPQYSALRIPHRKMNFQRARGVYETLHS